VGAHKQVVNYLDIKDKKLLQQISNSFFVYFFSSLSTVDLDPDLAVRGMRNAGLFNSDSLN
jgi:hypothetical protein